MRVLSTAALIAALMAAVSPVAALAGNLLDLSVIDRDSGRSLPTYRDHGKLYVAGTPGHRYSVRMTNRSAGRVLAVLSVDGVNAVTGATANPDQTGYVLDAWQSTDIAGWRKSSDEIAQFKASSPPPSSCAATYSTPWRRPRRRVRWARTARASPRSASRCRRRISPAPGSKGRCKAGTR